MFGNTIRSPISALLRKGISAANETAVKLFLSGKIKFTDIMKIVEKVLSKHKTTNNPSLDDILNVEKWADEEVFKFC